MKFCLVWFLPWKVKKKPCRNYDENKKSYRSLVFYYLFFYTSKKCFLTKAENQTKSPCHNSIKFRQGFYWLSLTKFSLFLLSRNQKTLEKKNMKRLSLLTWSKAVVFFIKGSATVNVFFCWWNQDATRVYCIDKKVDFSCTKKNRGILTPYTLPTWVGPSPVPVTVAVPSAHATAYSICRHSQQPPRSSGFAATAGCVSGLRRRQWSFISQNWFVNFSVALRGPNSSKPRITLFPEISLFFALIHDFQNTFL